MAESNRKKSIDIFERPGAKAPVWKFFGIRNQIENNSAVCRICGQDVPTKGGTTSCMISHLKNHHPPQYEDIHKSKRKLPGLNAELASSSKCTRTELNHFNTSEDNVINSNLDFEKLFENPNSDNSVTVDKDGLKTDLFGNAKVTEILQNLSPNLTLPDCLHFNEVALTNRYEKLKKQIELELNEVQFVAVAIDSMIDFHLDDYFNVTCRFITSEWEMKSRTLQTIFVPKFSEKLFDSVVLAVKEITDLWSITDKVVATTRCTGMRIWEKDFFQRATFVCMGCHMDCVLYGLLNSNILKPIRLVVEKLFLVFSYGIKKQALQEAQISLNLPVQQLRVESKSLCCSWYWSFRRILDQKPAIEKAFKELKYFTFACPPSQEQYDVIKDVCDVLKPLMDIIEKPSNNKNMIVSSLLPLYKQLTKCLEKDSSDSKMVADLKDCLIDKLEIFIEIVRYEKEFALKSSFLDPRFKNFLEPNEQQQVLSELSSEAAEKMNRCATSDAYVETILRSADSFQFSNQENEYNQVTFNFPTVMQTISSEIDNYLAEPVIDEAEDPLKWWRNKQLVYRYLAVLAKKYLCCYSTCSSAKNFNLKDCCRQPFPSGNYSFPDGVNILSFLFHNS